MFCDEPPAASIFNQGGDMDMTVCVLDKLECWRQHANEEPILEDHTADIEFELNPVQLSQTSRKEEKFGERTAFKIPGVPPPTV